MLPLSATRRLVFVLLLVAACCGSVPASATRFVPTPNAVWVYPDPAFPDPISDATARQALVNNSAASNVTMLFVSVYRGTPNANGRYMYEDADLADLIARAHQQFIQVWAAYGAPDWPSLGCSSTGFPMQRMAELAAYNGQNYSPVFNIGGVDYSYSGKFDGVILDIEPSDPQTAAQYTALLDQYQCLQVQAHASGLPLSVAIRFYWWEMLTYATATMEVYKHIVQMIVGSGMLPGNVVIMGYRDFTGPADCSTDGLICLDKDIIHYAFSLGSSNGILAGLETSNPFSTGISDKETFYEEGQDRMNAVAREVFTYFGPWSGLGGFAIHNFQNSYLTGSAAWPSTNPGFPSAGTYFAAHSATPAGAPQTSTLDLSPNAVITVTFPAVGAAGATYASPIDPATAGQLPNGYLSTGALAFELQSTASYTGPVVVCFQLPSLTPAAFTTLAVLHDNGSGLVDVTVHGLPSNATTKTICGSVPSFSPFLIARKSTVVADTAPPTTIASLSPNPNAAGWNRADVTVTLRSTDGSGGSGVRQVRFSTAGAQTGTGVVAGSSGRVTVTTEGTTTITYFAIDNAGNGEAPRSIKVKIDKTPPAISGLPDEQCTLWPPNHKLVQIATVTTRDGMSGVSAFDVSGTSSEPANAGEQDVVITGAGIGARTVQVRADRLGTGTGRVYTLSATATDSAGNTSAVTAKCIVPHDKGK